MPLKIEKYSRRVGGIGPRRWYWRFRHINGNVMGDSAEAYNSKQARDDAVETILDSISNSRYTIRDEDLGDNVGGRQTKRPLR